MITAARFSAPTSSHDGRVIRHLRFVATSTLPVSAACVVANGVREALTRLLARDFEVELIEPTIPGIAERAVLVEGAVIARVRGRICDGFVMVRPTDARAIVACAFGESRIGESLSEIERSTLERVVGALVPLCTTLCGTLGPVCFESPERTACDLTTYFEVRATGTPSFSIGFGLARDPAEAVCDAIPLAALADVELEATVDFACGTLSIPAFSRLAVGSTVVLVTPLDAHGTLRFGEVAFARGVCGARDRRSAFTVETLAAVEPA